MRLLSLNHLLCVVYSFLTQPETGKKGFFLFVQRIDYSTGPVLFPVPGCFCFGLTKNRKYYEAVAASEQENGISKHIYYGGQIFDELFRRPDVWQEICAHLSRSKQERSQEVLDIPDFDTSEEISLALDYIKKNKPQKYKKLFSGKTAYVQLRKEIFPSNTNPKRAA